VSVVENWSLAASLHILILLAVTLRVVSQRLYPGTALAWLLLVASVPYGGLALYILLGERPLGRARARRIERLYPPERPWLGVLATKMSDLALTVRQQDLAKLATQSLGAPALGGARLTLLEGAPDILGSLARDIVAARVSCHLEFYIWNAGGLADGVAEALIAAARRGVDCRLLLDAVGSRPFLRGPWPARLKASGVRVVTALPVGPLRAAFVRIDLRLHRKIAVIDGQVAYTGSLNLVDPRYFKQGAGVGEWVDAMVRVEGPPVQAMDSVFQRDWVAEGGQPSPARDAGPAETVGQAVLHVVPSGPDLAQDALRRLLVAAIYDARREVVITTPYFVPDEAVVLALESAAQRGVAVTLIVPARVDSRLVRYASRSYFGDLMAAGVRICQFRGGLLHTKSLTVDGEVTLFGTSNLDIRSLRLNFEVTVIAYDAPFTTAVRALQARYESDAATLELTEWRLRGRLRRLVDNAARLASPLL
jgi:cardiolipin synthase